MFGLHYELICPYCGKTSLADHGITSYYNIQGYGDTEYIREYCWHCKTSYLRACYGSDAMNMKLKGFTYEEAIEELQKQDDEKNKKGLGKFYANISEERLKYQEEKRIKSCNDVYFTDNKKLYIDMNDINKEDLTVSSVVCW